MTKCSSPLLEWENKLKLIRDDCSERVMRCALGPVEPKVKFLDGEKLVFCSNDYLGLASHPEVKRAMIEAVEKYGCGSGASRLVSGNTVLHNELESQTAKLLSKEDSVYFASGYQANVGALSCLLDDDDAIFSDELVHASIIDGARLSKAKVYVYRHSDMADLDRLLNEYKEFRTRMIVTDSIFSMDGEKAKLVDIVRIATRHNVAVYLDEAHAVGVIGPSGAGLAAELGLQDKIDVIVGTYSKAFGVSGAFVATSKSPAAIIRSRARSLLFSTGQPPALAAAIMRSMEISAEADCLRENLIKNIAVFKSSAAKHGLPIIDSETAIQPIIIGSNKRTMEVSELLLKDGFFVQGIRPPTVKPGESRLRVTMSAAHQTVDIERLAESISRNLLKL